jgi:hypothetical protein
MKLKRKGALELSASVIVVIVISIVILVGGLSMFFKLKTNAQSYVDSLDSQTEDRIKSMMLSGTDHVAVYPSDPIIGPNDAQLIGVGITNIYDGTAPLNFKVEITAITIYSQTTETPVPNSDLIKYYDMTATPISIAPHNQYVKGILLKIPGSTKGQYVYTIKILVEDTGTNVFKEYGVLQVYAIVK